MSNAKKRTDGVYSLEAYKKKASEKADKKGAFSLQVDPETTITLDRPSASQMFDAEAALQGGDSRGLISALCGEQADDVLDLFADEDFAVLGEFGKDLQVHFGIGV